MVDIVDCYRDVDDSKKLLKNFRDGRNIMHILIWVPSCLSTLSGSLEEKGNIGWQVRGNEKVGGGTGLSG